jgi:hypothetical protein
MHVSSGPGTGDDPTRCAAEAQLPPQEKALAFLCFDIASCADAGL